LLPFRHLGKFGAHRAETQPGPGERHQKPETRATGRDEQAITRWKREDWPWIKKATLLGAHLVFVDESGFLRIPHLVKTWTPRGRTPVQCHRYRREKISVISGISVSPQRHRLGLYYQLYFQNIGQQEMCVFLRHLLRHLRGPVIALLDNSQTRKGKPLHELRWEHPHLHTEHFPSYAPELNQTRGVWSLAKRELANGRPDDVQELTEDLIHSIETIRRSPHNLRACILQSELPLLGVDHCIVYAAHNQQSHEGSLSLGS
jgi:transposase